VPWGGVNKRRHARGLWAAELGVSLVVCGTRLFAPCFAFDFSPHEISSPTSTWEQRRGCAVCHEGAVGLAAAFGAARCRYKGLRRR
jgi:hypothetical protein